MEQFIKIFTHESTVHTQIEVIQETLKREVKCEITINVKDKHSCIQFTADENELENLKNSLGNIVLVRTGKHWVPYI